MSDNSDPATAAAVSSTVPSALNDNTSPAAPVASAVIESEAAAAERAAPCTRSARTQIQTVQLDPRDLRASWPLAIATLKQMGSWTVLALRLGTLALIQSCVRELAQSSACPEVIAQLRVLTDALAHMPLEA